MEILLYRLGVASEPEANSSVSLPRPPAAAGSDDAAWPGTMQLLKENSEGKKLPDYSGPSGAGKVPEGSWEMRELFFPGPDRTGFVGHTTQGRPGGIRATEQSPGPQSVNKCHPSFCQVNPKSYTSGPVWDGPASPRQPWVLPLRSPDVSAVPSQQPTAAFFTEMAGAKPKAARTGLARAPQLGRSES